MNGYVEMPTGLGEASRISRWTDVKICSLSSFPRLFRRGHLQRVERAGAASYFIGFS